MKRSRRVKILATLGPSSSEENVIQQLYEAGADTFRINMSHSTHDMMRELIRRIRSVEKKVGYPIGILADLQGPKHRLGTFANGPIEINSGDVITLDSNPEPGDNSRVYLPHPEVLGALSPGDRLLVDDGRATLVVESCGDGSVSAKVVSGTSLSNRKGVSLPDTELATSSLTPKDHKDLDAILQEDVDWVALSFVQRPEDLAEMRKICQGRVGILAKIEKPQAVEKLSEIIELADCIMVARGDLGVELPLESVPAIQKHIVRKCRRAGKPVIVATQMLESMISSPVPTRAEVSDVATAVYEGADAVMLSAESAAGKCPVEAVSTMDAIARNVEIDPNYPGIINAQRPEPEPTGADAISLAVRQIAETLNLSAVVCYTATGSTGLRAARERPTTPILALSPIPKTARRLTLVWGLHSVITPDAVDLDEMVDKACHIAFEEGFANPGDRVIVSAGVPLRTPGSTNMLRIAYVNSDGMGGV
jgi:pyruvate kinase